MKIEIVLDSDELLSGAGQPTFEGIKWIEVKTLHGHFQLKEVDGYLEVLGLGSGFGLLTITPTGGNVVLLSQGWRGTT